MPSGIAFRPYSVQSETKKEQRERKLDLIERQRGKDANKCGLATSRGGRGPEGNTKNRGTHISTTCTLKKGRTGELHRKNQEINR